MIPSYDDLTPSIPDVVESKTVSELAVFLRDDLVKGRSVDREPAGQASQRRHPHDPPESRALYACLRSSMANAELHALVAIARDFSPRVMRASDVEVLLDVSGLGRLIGEPPAIERELRRAVIEAELDAAVAIAPTQTAARLLAASCRPGLSDPAWGDAGPERSGRHPAHGDARSQRPGLHDLSIDLLQPLETLPPAMNHRDRERPYETFQRWGIATLGDLAALPVTDLSSRLGRRGVALHRLARGLDPRPFVPDADTPRYVGRLELEWPIEELEPLSFVFARLLDPLSAALERADRGAVAVHLDLRLTDRRIHQRLLQLPAPMRDARVLRTLLLLDLEANPPRGASEGRREPPRSGGPSAQRGGERRGAPPSEVMIDIVTIELDPAPGRITHFSLLERALPSPETLSTLIARLSALSGESRVGAAALIDTHAPGAFHMERFALETDAVGATGASGAASAAGALVFRRQRVPPAIRVSVEHGRPVHLASSRRGMPHGAVVQAAGPWRSSGGWWIRAHCRAVGKVTDDGRAKETDDGRAGGVDARRAKGKRGDARRAQDADARRAQDTDARRAVGKGLRDKAEGPWNRDEWDVALKTGVVCRIYHDRTTECWFLEGLYD